MTASPLELAPDFFRRSYGRLVAMLVRRYGAHQLEQAEDVAQSALEQALHHWRKQGLPERPQAWLNTVAKRKMIDRLRHQGHTERVQSEVAAIEGLKAAVQEQRSQQQAAHDQLGMLFLCCDPQLAPQSQMVLALKTLCGFSTQEIALRLFLSEANVHKRLSRARKVLREAWGPSLAQGGATKLAELSTEQRRERYEPLLRVLYLLFNEGYASSQAEAPLRRELCEEAIVLTQNCLEYPQVDHSKAQALLALMYLHLSRFEARTTPKGDYILLEDQDRSRWDKALIAEGLRYLQQSSSAESFSRYHAEAGISAHHCMAPSYEQSNWEEIAQLYELLYRHIPSPLYRLSRAIAIAQAQGPAAGLALMQEVEAPDWLRGYYLWDATLGELYRRDKQLDRAREHLERALTKVQEGPDRKLILARLEACARECCDSTTKE